MTTQVFGGEELERLRGFPEIGREELFRFFTLAPADVAFVDPGRGRPPADRLPSLLGAVHPLLALRDGLRTGDVYVPGSRRYADPAAYLLTPDAWSTHRASFCQLVGKSADPAVALAAVADELAGALGELEQVLATGEGSVRLDDAGELVISPLTAEDIPCESAQPLAATSVRVAHRQKPKSAPSNGGTAGTERASTHLEGS